MHKNSLLKFEITRFDILVVRNHSINRPDVYFKLGTKTAYLNLK